MIFLNKLINNILKNKARFYLICFLGLPSITVIIYRDVNSSIIAILTMIIFGLKLSFLKCKFCGKYLMNNTPWFYNSTTFWSTVIVNNKCPRCGQTY